MGNANFRLLIDLGVIVVGAYLLTHKHKTAGAWLIFAGIIDLL